MSCRSEGTEVRRVRRWKSPQRGRDDDDTELSIRAQNWNKVQLNILDSSPCTLTRINNLKKNENKLIFEAAFLCSSFLFPLSLFTRVRDDRACCCLWEQERNLIHKQELCEIRIVIASLSKLIKVSSTVLQALNFPRSRMFALYCQVLLPLALRALDVWYKVLGVNSLHVGSVWKSHD